MQRRTKVVGRGSQLGHFADKVNNRPGKYRVLCFREELFLVLVKLKTAYHNQELQQTMCIFFANAGKNYAQKSHNVCHCTVFQDNFCVFINLLHIIYYVVICFRQIWLRFSACKQSTQGRSSWHHWAHFGLRLG